MKGSFDDADYQATRMGGDVARSGALHRQQIHGDGVSSHPSLDEQCEWLAVSLPSHGIEVQHVTTCFIGKNTMMYHGSAVPPALGEEPASWLTWKVPMTAGYVMAREPRVWHADTENMTYADRMLPGFVSRWACSSRSCSSSS